MVRHLVLEAETFCPLVSVSGGSCQKDSEAVKRQRPEPVVIGRSWEWRAGQEAQSQGFSFATVNNLRHGILTEAHVLDCFTQTCPEHLVRVFSLYQFHTARCCQSEVFRISNILQLSPQLRTNWHPTGNRWCKHDWFPCMGTVVSHGRTTSRRAACDPAAVRADMQF